MSDAVLMVLFEDKLLDAINSNALFDKVRRILLAVSGGADSVAMVHVLSQLKDRGGLSCEFVLGHVNHCLRGGESDADEAFVAQLGKSLGVVVVSQKVDVKQYAGDRKLSVETAGRNLRLQALADMAKAHGCDCVVTAHHKDDLAETMVHRLMRGTGFRGLCGIRPISDVYGAKFIRPLLGVRRAEIIQYCRENSILWREDTSNTNLTFTRNRIRHSLLPILLNSCAHPADLIDNLAGLAQGAQRFSMQTEKRARGVLDGAISDHQPDSIILQQARLSDCPPWVFYEVIRKVLMMLDVGLRNYTQGHFDTIRDLMDQQQADTSMPGGIQVYAKKGILGFYRKTMSPCFPSESVRLEIGKTAVFGPWRVASRLLDCDEVDVERFYKTKNAFVEWFEADEISGLLEIRRRRDGDRFWPIGAKSEKRVGRFLIDAQLDKKNKKRAFVVADAEKILWVGPVRMSEQVKITPQTRRILEIRVSESRQQN